jgi:hypothetical protein
MLKTRTILIVTCQPGISLLCSSSSYKIFNVMNILFQIGILCLETKLGYDIHFILNWKKSLALHT